MDKLPSYKYFNLELLYFNKILVVTLNRPPVNAFIKESYDELSSIVDYVRKNREINVVLLKSDGKVFCAGADINQVAADSPEVAVIRREALRKSGTDIYTCPVPLITAVNGGAIGYGALLAAAGDIVLASKNAFFGLTEINVGLVGGAAGLSRFLPPHKVKTMALTGLRVPAQEAYMLGAVEAVVEPEELLDKAMEYAKIVADKGSAAVRKWKEALLVTETLGARDGLLVEQCLSQELVLLDTKPKTVRQNA